MTLRPTTLPHSLAIAVSLVAGLASLAAPAVAQEAIGVASCDSFLKTYQACIASKVPEAQRTVVGEALEKTRANWKAVAATAEGKTQLDAICKDTAEKLKKEVAALNCSW